MNEIEMLTKKQDKTKTFDGTVIGVQGNSYRIKTQTGTVMHNVPGAGELKLGDGVLLANNSPGANKFSVLTKSYPVGKAATEAEV